MQLKQIRKQMNKYSAQRVDIVFGTYKDQSSKTSTRVKRGKGIRRKVLDKSVAPTNWRSFLRLDQNKTEIFCYLSITIIQHGDRGHVIMICAYDDTCINSSNDLDLSNLTPCNHEEADTRVFLHVKDMTQQGYTKMVIRKVDTNVLVLAVSVYEQLQEEMEELLVDFGAGKNRKFFPIQETLEHIGECKARGFPLFHAFTRCDKVSFMSHVTKSAAWKVWNLFDDITPIFAALSHQPIFTQIRDAMPTIERFTVLLYSCTSNCLTTNKYRRELFCQGRSIDNLPPTSAALWKHTL